MHCFFFSLLFIIIETANYNLEQGSYIKIWGWWWDLEKFFFLYQHYNANGVNREKKEAYTHTQQFIIVFHHIFIWKNLKELQIDRYFITICFFFFYFFFFNKKERKKTISSFKKNFPFFFIITNDFLVEKIFILMKNPAMQSFFFSLILFSTEKWNYIF